MRPIDADALHITVTGGRMNGKVEFAKAIEEAIKKAPTIDAVPVIRCKDCKDYQQGSRNSDDWLWCMMNHHYTDEEKYCAWAERKEE